MKYRPEIDGLRTVAVVPVVLFHAGLPGFAGGYAGVDIFFVISGFLITTLLMEDLRHDRFSILRFYERRARRILPALILVVAAATLAALLTLPPPRIEEYGASMIATALFGANIYFWRTTDYFATAADERPLLHMWSLAVEEQFYIVFPLLLFLLWRWRRSTSGATFGATFLGLAALSFALAVVSAGWKPVANFYLPMTRAWELLAGSLVALALRGAPPARTAAAPWLAGLGLILVLGALVGIDDTTPWPGAWTMVPVLGTALILAFVQADCPAGRLLGWRPMVWIGLLSYSIYLWHQPLLVFARIAASGHPSPTVMGGLALATLPLSWLTWRFVERPFRTRPAQGGFSRGTIFTAAGAGLTAVTLIGAVPMIAPGLTERVYLARLSQDPRTRYLSLKEIIDPGMRADFMSHSDGPCRRNFNLVTPEAVDMLLRCTADGQRAVIVTGGSHGMDLYAALTAASKTEVVLGFARGYCRPHRRLETVDPRPHDCPFDALRDLVAAHPDRIALVIYTQAGFSVFDDYREVRSAEGLHRDLLEEVGDYLADLARHVPVLALGPKPYLGIDPRLLSLAEPFDLQIARAQDPGILVAMSAVDRAFADIFKARGIPYLSHAEAIGSVLPQDAILENRLTYRDHDHWSLYGAEIFGARLLATLDAQGYQSLFPPR